MEGEKKEKGNGGSITFNVDLKKLINDYENSYKSYSQKIYGFLETSQLMIDQLLEPSKNSIAEMPKPPLITLPNIGVQSTSNQAVSYTFSPTLKT